MEMRLRPPPRTCMNEKKHHYHLTNNRHKNSFFLGWARVCGTNYRTKGDYVDISIFTSCFFVVKKFHWYSCLQISLSLPLRLFPPSYLPSSDVIHLGFPKHTRLGRLLLPSSSSRLSSLSFHDRLPAHDVRQLAHQEFP
jgi:hypothetical protein